MSQIELSGKELKFILKHDSIDWKVEEYTLISMNSFGVSYLLRLKRTYDSTFWSTEIYISSDDFNYSTIVNRGPYTLIQVEKKEVKTESWVPV